jgi:hypothetical protein
LAKDTNIDIIVTGDFNLDTQKLSSKQKIDNICMENGLS